MAHYQTVTISAKYRILKGISLLLKGIGYFILALGLIGFIISLFSSHASYDQSSMQQGMFPFPMGAMFGVVKFISLLFSIIFGVMFIAYGEFINLFLDIESNQRTMIEMQKQVINNLPESPVVVTVPGTSV